MQAVKIQQLVEKNMTYIIASSIILGTLFGLYFPALTPALKPWIPVTLFLMLYPMMVGIQVEQLTQAAKNGRIIFWSLLLNFIISPLLGFLVATILLGHTPPFAVALILLAATPCAGMVVGWTGMAKGNAPLALVIVALSLVLSIVTIPLTMRLLAGTLVTVDIGALFKGTFLVILFPLVLGDITRRLIIRWSGPLTVAMLAINPLIQAPLMAWFLRWSSKHMPVTATSREKGI